MKKSSVASLFIGALFLLVGSVPLAASAEVQCSVLIRTLSLGSRGSDVVTLQQFLIANNYLAAGNSSGYFGQLTQSAVQQFQIAHNIVSSGSPTTTGFGSVGSRTRQAIATSCGNSGGGTGGGTIQVPSFYSSVTSGNAPMSVTFYATGLNSIYSYSIDFGDGSQTVSFISSASHTYNNTGTYKARLINNTLRCFVAGCEVVGTVNITVSSTQTSNAYIQASPTSGTAPLSVTFTASSGNADAGTFYVDFGDNSRSNAGVLAPTHIYALDGTYTASLKRTASAGGATVQTLSITVGTSQGGGGSSSQFNVTPTSGAAPLGVVFTTDVPNTAVSFGDGSSDSMQQNCTTGLDGGGTCLTGSYFTSHTYKTKGTFTAKLLRLGVACTSLATDCNVITSKTVTVGGTSSSGGNASFAATPTSGSTPLTVQFSARNSENAVVDFGDGTSGTVTALASTNCIQSSGTCGSLLYGVSHTYRSTGTFTAKLLDANMTCYTSGCNVTGTVTITVGGTTGGTSFSVNPASGAAPLTVQFTAYNSENAVVDFGDGTTGTVVAGLRCVQNSDGSTTCNSPFYSVAHTYSNGGTYNAKLIDANMTCYTAGCNVTGLATVTVSGASQSSTTFGASPTSGTAPLGVVFTTNYSGGYVDYGDGSTRDQVAANCTISFEGISRCSTDSFFTNHYYQSAGTYTARLYSGNTSSASVVKTVTVTVGH